jgi:hypothetical protein
MLGEEPYVACVWALLIATLMSPVFMRRALSANQRNDAAAAGGGGGDSEAGGREGGGTMKGSTTEDATNLGAVRVQLVGEK